MDFAQDGSLDGFDAEEVAQAVLWDGSPELLWSSLISARFVDTDEDGRASIHDWADYAGRLIEKRRADAERKRMSRGRPADVTRPSGVTVPNRTVPDLTKPDSSPQPPPQAEGENPPTPRKRGARSGQRGGFAAGSEQASDPVGGGGVAVEDLAPPSDADAALWDGSRSDLAQQMSRPNWETYIAPLTVAGRAADGGLRLRAPPGLTTALKRFRSVIVRSLVDAGDPGATRVAIVEARPGQE